MRNCIPCNSEYTYYKTESSDYNITNNTVKVVGKMTEWKTLVFTKYVL